MHGNKIAAQIFIVPEPLQFFFIISFSNASLDEELFHFHKFFFARTFINQILNLVRCKTGHSMEYLFQLFDIDHHTVSAFQNI